MLSAAGSGWSHCHRSVRLPNSLRTLHLLPEHSTRCGTEDHATLIPPAGSAYRITIYFPAPTTGLNFNSVNNLRRSGPPHGRSTSSRRVQGFQSEAVRPELAGHSVRVAVKTMVELIFMIKPSTRRAVYQVPNR